MLIYNVTYAVDLDVEAQFLDWMRTKYIPRALASGDLCNARLSMIMATEDQEKHRNYSVQFDVDSLDVLERWAVSCGNEVIGDFVKKFGNKAPGFPTLMERVEL